MTSSRQPVPGGLLISLDGPGGVGKTTLTRMLTDQLAALDHLPVHATTEPSATPLGRFTRHSPEHLDGLALACLVTADRYQHLATDIQPALARGQVVVTDRYLPASLVLQRRDGVDVEFIWQLNRHVRRPDLAVILHADPAVLTQRLLARGPHNRFERPPDASAIESRLYQEAVTLLTAAGWPVVALDCSTATTSQLAASIRHEIHALLEARPPP